MQSYFALILTLVFIPTLNPSRIKHEYYELFTDSGKSSNAATSCSLGLGLGVKSTVKGEG